MASFVKPGQSVSLGIGQYGSRGCTNRLNRLVISRMVEFMPRGVKDDRGGARPGVAPADLCRQITSALAYILSAAVIFTPLQIHASVMWREVQPMGFVTNYCLHPGLQALLAFLSRREALTPIGAVEVLGDFDLAAGPHV